MSQQDKEFIKRIQINQLASSDPYSDDFYYQVYSSLRQRAGLPVWSASAENAAKSNRGRKEENGMQRLHQQLQRMVNNAKRHPRQAQGMLVCQYHGCSLNVLFFTVSLEGALGKITSLTVRNPRQVLQVSEKKTNPTPGSHEGAKQDSKQTVGKANCLSVCFLTHVYREPSPTSPPRLTDDEFLESSRTCISMYSDLSRCADKVHPSQSKVTKTNMKKLSKPGTFSETDLQLVITKHYNRNAKYADQTTKLWTSLRLLDQTDGTYVYLRFT